MQLIAILTMLIDHIGVIFFPESILWRIIGRIAFPIYAFGITVGYQMTRSRPRYLLRLALLALIAQVPYMLAFDTTEFNVIFTLLGAALVLCGIDQLRAWPLPRTLSWLCIGLLTAAAFILMQRLPLDYSGYGLLLVLIYRYARGYKTILLHLALNVVFLFMEGWVLQFFSLLPTMLFVYGAALREGLNKISVPRWLWRSFYPAHLAALAALEFMVNNR